LEHPEVHSPHRRHGGLPRWLELLIAITALITSISSIAIAVKHGRIMERLVQANSIPYIQGGFSDVLPDGARVLSLDLLNRGVGPAHERSLRVTVDGKNVTSVRELMRASLGPALADDAYTALNPMKNGLKTRFIPGGDEQLVFRMFRTDANARYWDMLADAQERWDAQYCYCSVFEECWEVLGKWEEPKPIEACVRNEAREFLP
jgi:hypothetical protein